MKTHTSSCPNCDQPFEVLLPDETTKTSYTECEDEDVKLHNLKHVSQCQNCEHRNTIYYCTNTHPLVAKGE